MIITWILSSSILILAILLIRYAFGSRMQAGARYALWGLVLMRLLIPWEVGSVPFGVAAAVENVTATVQEKQAAAAEVLPGESPVEEVPAGQPSGTSTVQPVIPAAPAGEAGDGLSGRTPGQSVTGNTGQTAGGTYRPAAAEPAPAAPAHTASKPLGWQQVLLLIWAAGAAVTAGVIAAGNLKLALFLHQNRRPLGTSGKRRVYAVAGLGSSCLFGSSIYVTGEALTDETLRRYVLAHENSHARHGDFAWSVLRCLALVIHWFNPLVWQAADLSRRDAEAFADAGALRELGDDERQAYGLALIRLYAGRSSGVSLAVTASTMTGGKKTLKERITRIASRPRLTAAAAIVLAGLLGLAAACSFGGPQKESTKAEQTVPSGTETEPSETETQPESESASVPSEPSSETEAPLELDRAAAEAYAADCSVAYDTIAAVRAGLDEDLAETVKLYLKTLHKSRANCRLSFASDEAVDAWKNAMPKLRRTDVYLTAKVLWNGEDRAAATLINSRLSHSQEASAPFNVIFLAERINGEWYIEKASVSDEYLTGTNDIPYDILLQVYRENRRLHPLTEEDIQTAATCAMDVVTGAAFTAQLTEEEKQLLRENLTFSYDPSWSDKATVRNQLAVKGWKLTNAPSQFLDIPALVVWVRPTEAFIGEHPDIADRYLGTWNGYYVYCCFLKEAYTWETGQVTEAGWYAEYPYFSSLPSFPDPDMPHNQVPDRPKEETQGVEVSFGEDDALQEDLKVTVTLYLEAISQGDGGSTLSEVFGDGAMQPFGHVRTENGRIRWKLQNVLYQDEEKALITMFREYPASGRELDPVYCVITAERRAMGWLITKACLTNLLVEVEGTWDLLYDQLAQMRGWALEKDPLTEEDLRKAAEAAFLDASELIFLGQNDPKEEREELAGSLEYEYDPQWAEHILITEWMAGTAWAKDPKTDLAALDADAKEVILWITPAEAYRARYPEVGKDFIGSGSAVYGWYFHSREVDEDTPAAFVKNGWAAGPVIWSTRAWQEEDGYPHSREP